MTKIGTYKLGARSKRELVGVHPDLVKVVHCAIEITEQDFTVFDGIRTAADQRALYRRGASQKDGYHKIGKHQKQTDGYGHAVDLVPWIKGKPQWDWPAIYLIADAMFSACRLLDVQLRWGGCWQHINPLNAPPELLVQEYVTRKRKAGKRAFNDGPHWELYGYL